MLSLLPLLLLLPLLMLPLLLSPSPSLGASSTAVVSAPNLLLSGVDGQLVLLNARSGQLIWSTSSHPALLASSHHDGLTVGKSNQIVLPALDGSLYYVSGPHSNSLDLLEVSVRDIVDSAPFRTTDGTRFVAKKHTKVLVLDAASGRVRRQFEPDACDHCAAADAGADASEEQTAHCKARDVDAQSLWIGQTDYVIRAINGASGELKWKVHYSQITSCREENLFAELPDNMPLVFASVDGQVWAVDPSSRRELWSTKLSSVLSSLQLQINEDVVPLSFTYSSRSASSMPSAALVALQPQLRQMQNGQVFVVANRAVPGGVSAPSTTSTSFPELNHLLLPSPIETGSESESELSPPEAPSSPSSSSSSSSSAPAVEQGARRLESIHITLQLPENPLSIAVSMGLAVLAGIFAYRMMSKTGKWLLGKHANFTQTQQRRRRKKTDARSKKTDEEVVAASDDDGMYSIGKIGINSRALLGLGSHGTIVFDGRFEGRPVAIKRLQKHLFMHASKEISLLIASDRHPHVLRYFAREDDANFIYVALERCRCALEELVSGTSLVDELRCPLTSTLYLLRDMVSGVEYLHSINIVHRDLKPQNVLVTSDNRPKIADMGLSTQLDRNRSSFDGSAVGSTGWHAPEILNGGRLTKAVDIFPLGSIIFYVLTGGKHPFGDGFERDANIQKSNYNLSLIAHLPEALDLVQSMLSSEPQLRPSCSEILQHPFFWPDDRKLEFLQEISDRIEVEKPDSELRRRLETQASRVVTRAWDRVLDPALLENLGKYRKYNFSSIRDCLRVIRNKKNHYRDLPPDVQSALGAYPSGFLHYFTARFPSLLLYTHAFAARFCASDLSRWYVGLSEDARRARWRLWAATDDDDDDELAFDGDSARGTSELEHRQ